MWSVSNNNIHIVDSYLITKRKDMYEILNKIKEEYPKIDVWKRSFYHITSEWKTHNRLYRLGLFKERVKDIDINYPQKWFIKIAYYILGV